jgi:hypothetical protein
MYYTVRLRFSGDNNAECVFLVLLSLLSCTKRLGSNPGAVMWQSP